MKKAINIFSLLLFTSGFSQVAIGKTSVSNTSVSLEFGSGNRGIILPWVTSAASVTGAVDGTLIYDIADKKVKYLKSGSWSDLTVDATGVVDTVLQASKVELPGAKMVIGTGGASDTTPGILVLKDTNKAMVLPKVASPHLNIINPSAGMMVYDTVKHQLAVFNGRYGLSGNLCNVQKVNKYREADSQCFRKNDNN
uniref:Uncharacterized protein n=1 Tax=Chryseobacterium endophyticum TaxID=1854762 RepID=A0AAU6WPQ4_9FLAO